MAVLGHLYSHKLYTIFAPLSSWPSFCIRHPFHTTFVNHHRTTFVTLFIPLSFFQNFSTTCQSVNSTISHLSRLSHLSHLSHASLPTQPSHNHEVLATERNHNMLTMILQHESRSGVRCRQAKDLDRGLPFTNRSSPDRAA